MIPLQTYELTDYPGWILAVIMMYPFSIYLTELGHIYKGDFR